MLQRAFTEALHKSQIYPDLELYRQNWKLYFMLGPR